MAIFRICYFSSVLGFHYLIFGFLVSSYADFKRFSVSIEILFGFTVWDVFLPGFADSNGPQRS